MATPTVRGRTAPAPGLSVTSPSATVQGDLLVIFTAERNGAGAATHTATNGFTLWGTTELDDASEDGRATIVYMVADVGGAASYTGVASTDGTTTQTGMVVITAGTYHLPSILYAGLATITTTVANPPSVTLLDEGCNWLVLTADAARSGASEDNAFTAPTNYANLIEESAASTLHLGIADRTLIAQPISLGIDPGPFTDTIAPTGSIGLTAAIRGPVAFPEIREVVAPVTGLTATSNILTEIGDLVVVVTWERAGVGVPTHTIQSGYTQANTVSHDDGSTDGRLSTAWTIATANGIQAYAAYTSSVGTDCWSALISFKRDTFNPVSPIYGQQGTSSTSNAAPNSPNAHFIDGTEATTVTEPFPYDVHILSIAAWHFATALDNTVTPPSTYALQTSIAGTQTSDLAITTKTEATPAVEPNPGAFTDNQTPNGTASCTICIRQVEPVSVPKAGMLAAIPVPL